MTLQQFIESISRVFPDKGQTEIVIDLNTVLRDFCERSKVLRDVLNMTSTEIVLDSTAGTQAEFTIDWNTVADGSGYVSFNFPTYSDNDFEIVALLNLRTYDDSNVQLSDMCAWNVIGNEVRIYNNVDTSTAAFPSTVTSMKFDIIRYDYALTPSTSLATVPAIPVEFHRAVEAKVMSMYYRRLPIISAPNAYGPMLAMAKSMENEYEEAVVKAKRLFNVNRNFGSYAMTNSI